MTEKQQKNDIAQKKRGESDKKLNENTKESLDRKLDQGVEESFPASDPVSVKITK